jgi:hypothetical protein
MHKGRLVAAVIVVGAVFLGSTNPASATITTHTSALGAGYKTVPSGGLASATVTFKVPDILCAHNNDYEALNLGLFALNSGVSSTTSFITVSCNNGVKNYFATAGAGTTLKHASIAIGDTVTARITETGTKRTAFFKDVTLNTTASISYAASKDQAVLIGDFGGTPVPTFDSIHMSATKINGVVVGDAPATNRERLKQGTDIQIGATLIQAGHATFTLLFQHNT